MATAAQIRANQANSQRSTGPASQAGKQASSWNRTPKVSANTTVNLSTCSTTKIPKNSPNSAPASQQNTNPKLKPNVFSSNAWPTMNGSACALCASSTPCIFEDQHVLATEQFALYLRYQTTHERAFYKALKELQTIRAQRTKDQIGFESFESQKLERAAEQRAAEAHNPKKQGFELKKEQFELKKKRLASSKRPEKDTGHATAPTSAGGIPVRPHVPAV